MYKRHVSEINEITEFSKNLRHVLSKRAFISNLKLNKRLKSSDGTEKFLFSLDDGNTVESVMIPDKDRLTLCISSQVGCALGCSFCQTGKLGFIRNLTSHEIVDQIIAVQKILNTNKIITNIVFMGMGEPLLNFDEVNEALWRITLFIGIAKRKITLSTAGIIPKLSLLSERAPEINLAVSLNATTDATRNEIMPINKKFPLISLVDACRKFRLGHRRMISFEYVLIEGINDSVDDAKRLAKLLRGLRCKINLIPLNPLKTNCLKRPSDRNVLKFQEILVQNNMTALIRRSKGYNIRAACGQLIGEYMF
jgi:23S rRNA (adenine2503-C2)-methyltransferase